MAVRTINAPGIQIREVDSEKLNSNVSKTDYSIVNTVSLVTGFADKGEDYTAKWINTIGTFTSEYGYPKNEPEKYFYNAAVEVLNRGGLLVTVKLPYDNNQKKYYPAVSYDIGIKELVKDNENYKYISQLDNALTSFIEIKNTNFNDLSANNLFANRITIDQLDSYKTNGFSEANKITIVDITKSQYNITTENTIITKSTDNQGTELETYTNDCLGIIPVLVSPANALIFQNILNFDTDNEHPLSDQDFSNILKEFNCLSSFKPNKPSDKNIEIDETDNKSFYQRIEGMLSIPLTSCVDKQIITESISKIAIQYFPTITQLYNNHFDTQYLKQIGVVVFKAYSDKANNNYITLTPVESFVGSLLRTAVDPYTKKSIFIDNIINTQSNYINLFSSANQTVLNNVSFISIRNQEAQSLGFYKKECRKIINYKNSIVDPLTIVFDKLHDRNVVNIDIVCDAGVSNISQFVVQKSQSNINGDYSFDFTEFPNISEVSWKLDNSDSTSTWLFILKKFDNFVGNTRKDCIFLADGLRTFCLDGNEKIVRRTNPGSTVEKNIIPKIRKLSGLNSTYSAGYCNWFLISDAYSGDSLWCPPSIKAMGIMIYSDTYYNKWDAPAGLNRATLNNVYDIGFNPSNEEADKIYSNSWNYAVSYPLNGIVLEGQKTFQLKKTALDRINIRRLMLHIEKSVLRVAKYFLYEQNSEYLRQKFVDVIKPIFEDVKNGNGIFEYYIKCDEQNNPENPYESTKLVCDIAVKPIRTLEYIIINFNCTQQSTSINEQVAFP